MELLFLHKLLPIAASPMGIIIFLASIGVIRRSFPWVIGSMALLIVVSTPVVSSSIWRTLETEYPHYPVDRLAQADATVVLSGMLSFSKSPYGLVAEWGDPDRFFSGIDIC